MAGDDEEDKGSNDGAAKDVVPVDVMPPDGVKKDESLISVNIDTRGLSDTSRVLVEKIARGLGRISHAFLAEREARAEVKAEIIRAEGQIKLSEIQRRGLERLAYEEGKKQENIESIAKKALPNVSDDAKPEDIEDDWMTHFFDRARLVSNEEMQKLWANLLSGEANKPGSFSRRTVDVVATLDKRDAEAFARFCSFIWMRMTPFQIIDQVAYPPSELVPVPMLVDFRTEILAKHDLSFDDLLHLDYIGLINFNTSGDYLVTNIPRQQVFLYYGRPLSVELPEPTKNTLNHGPATLTRAGKELVGVCTAKPNGEHYEYVIGKWIEQGYAVSCGTKTKDFHKPF